MLRGIRGATTVDTNHKDKIIERTAELLRELQNINNVYPEDIGAVIFSSTPDINAAFPAAAARTMGWLEVPLFGTQEIENPDGVPLCIRILVLWNTDKKQSEIQHAYLHGATRLRPDLAVKD